MNATYFLSDAAVNALVADVIAAGTRVLTPVVEPDVQNAPDDAPHTYREVSALPPAPAKRRLPRLPLKGAFLPPSEPLLRWQQTKDGITLTDVPTTFKPTLVWGALPCDAAAVAALDKVMSWDYKDELWFGRRQATVIATLACPGGDDACFCTAVGLAPDSTVGADLLLVPVAGGLAVEVATEKGAAFVAAHARHFAPAKADDAAARYRAAARAQVAGRVQADPAAVRGWLQQHFDHDIWTNVAARCHGCGICASVCPTCHCFDIVDEPEGHDRGTRRRNWDTCQTALFTVHGSGHNPRANQNARFRQRVQHKFRIYPERFDTLLCTGCGRCSRACPGGMDMAEILQVIDRLAKAEAPRSGGVA